MIGVNSFEVPELSRPMITAIPRKPVGFRLRVELLNTNPPVWRAIEVPGSMHLDIVHIVLQAAMGWTNSHLHHFQQTPHHLPFITDFEFYEDGSGVLESNTRLDQVVSKPGDTLSYLYDYGDAWDHLITVVAVINCPAVFPRCISGERACPPEDTGGIYTFNLVAPWVASEFHEALEPQHIDADLMRGWLGDWHPGTFSVDDSNACLQAEIHRHIRLAPMLNRIMAEVPAMMGEQLDHLLESEAWRTPTARKSTLTLEMMQPYVELIKVISPSTKLTAAKYLPPAVVQEYIGRIGLNSWPGTQIKREFDGPVFQIRETARDFGLVRIYGGTASPTNKASSLQDDPQALAEHFASRLPLGKGNFNQYVGWVTLVVAGGGGTAITDHCCKSIITAAFKLLVCGDFVVVKGFLCLGGGGVGYLVSYVYFLI